MPRRKSAGPRPNSSRCIMPSGPPPPGPLSRNPGGGMLSLGSSRKSLGSSLKSRGGIGRLLEEESNIPSWGGRSSFIGGGLRNPLSPPRSSRNIPLSRSPRSRSISIGRIFISLSRSSRGGGPLGPLSRCVGKGAGPRSIIIGGGSSRCIIGGGPPGPGPGEESIERKEL